MRFVYLVGVVGALLLAMVSGTYVYVSAHPQTPDSMTTSGINLCNDKPCFLDITPGHTPWVNLPRMLKRFNVQGNQLSFYINLNKSVHAEISYRFETYVHQIVITNYSSSLRGSFPSAGDFLARYGAPCRVEVRDPAIRLIYPLMTVTLNADKSLRPDTAVLSVVQVGNYAAGDPCFARQNSEHTLQWSGFASINRYRTLLTKP